MWSIKIVRGRTIFLENVSKSKVLGTQDEEVKLVENNQGQQWEMGEPNREGYFTITHPSSEKALTASFNQNFELKGKQ
jgi:hypothetical protein